MIFNAETRCTCDEVVRLAEAEGRAAKHIHRPQVATEGSRESGVARACENAEGFGVVVGVLVAV